MNYRLPDNLRVNHTNCGDSKLCSAFCLEIIITKNANYQHLAASSIFGKPMQYSTGEGLIIGIFCHSIITRYSILRYY